MNMEKLEIEIFLKLRELMEYPEDLPIQESVDSLHQALSFKFANAYVKEHGYDVELKKIDDVLIV